MTLRLGTSSDQWVLEELQRRASLANPGDREHVLANPEIIQLPISQLESSQVIVAEKNGQAIGFAVVIPRNDGNCELDGLFVDPAAWKMGIGRFLVEESKAMAATSGATYLHVIGNPHAEGFYLKCGFVTEGTHQTQFGPALLMKIEV